MVIVVIGSDVTSKVVETVVEVSITGGVKVNVEILRGVVVKLIGVEVDNVVSVSVVVVVSK